MVSNGDNSSSSSSSIAIPVIAGLAVGIGLVILFALFMTHVFAKHIGGAPATEKDFLRAERLQSVQLFEEKYPTFTKGFSQNSTSITYHYDASKWVDADGDGNDESFRRLSLSATFQGNSRDNINGSGVGNSNEDATTTTSSGLVHIEIRCDSASIGNRTLHNFIAPVYGEKNVIDFLQHAKCII